MSIVRWDPFAEMQRLLSPSFARSGLPRLGRGDGDLTVEWSPSADISETGAEYVIRAELPGVRKEDIKVSLADGLITLEGERRQQKEDKSEKLHRVESFYGSFSRSFVLPDNVRAEAVRSDYKDGVLTVRIPKAEKQQPKQIPVQ